MKKLVLFVSLISSTVLQGQYRCQDFKSHSHALPFATPPSIINNGKSDTIDILHYTINLDMTQIASRQLEGSCDISFVPKMNGVNSLSLDLLELQIDSIEIQNQNLGFSYDDTIALVSLPQTYNIGDTTVLTVYYQGQPQLDGSGWGGLHTQSGYYFNLGVGFAADPHTYGRAWFPCFDNFVEKSTYDFNILTRQPNHAYCNGLLIGESIVSGDTLLAQWQMGDEIPTYLASFAVSSYELLQDTVLSQDGVKPIWIMGKAADTTGIKVSFQNIKPILHSMENAFGPYYWEKIGYAMTTVGAMEHSTSIHLPINLADGTLNGEDIIAHELAHHWWGNLVTCQTDADMWINEGMAEYTSHLYTEHVYGRDRYLDEVMNNAYQVLNVAHIRDDGYKAIQGLDHEYVYGFHVYQKGAMVGHNMRAYLGDSQFFSGLTTLLANNMYGNLNSTQFRDQLTQITGYNMNDFFDSWVYNPGFPQFSLDSLVITSPNTALVKVSQRIREAPSPFLSVPVNITLFSANGDTVSYDVLLNGNSTTATLSNLPFTPAFGLAGYNGKLLSGSTYDEHIIDQTTIYADRYSKMRLTATGVNSPAEVIVMHQWAGPGGKIPAGKDYRLSTSRYWTVKGWDLNNVTVSGRINYRGGPTGFDEDLVGQTEDSLVVLYRALPYDEWQLYPDQVKVDIGSPTNGIGYIDVLNLKEGEYTLANTIEKVGLKEESFQGRLNIYPNPSEGIINIDFNDLGQQEFTIEVYTVRGAKLYERIYTISKSKETIQIDLQDKAKGNVIVKIDGQGYPVSLVK